MTKESSKRIVSKKGKYQESAVLKSAVKRLKKATGKKMAKSAIKKVWRDYVEHFVIPELMAGKSVQLNKRNKIEVVGEKIVKGTRSYDLISKGMYVTRTGFIKKADNMNKRRLGVKYGVKLITDYDKKFYFRPHSKISKSVHKALNETMVNYRILS